MRILSFRRFDYANVGGIGKSDALTSSVNKAVLFYGVRMFGDSRRSQYEVNFKINEKNVTAIYTSQQDGDGALGYVVMLTKPISLLPDEEFTITATINDEIPAGYSRKTISEDR